MTRWLCTPEHLDDLAAGWLLAEGRIGPEEPIDFVAIEVDGTVVRIEHRELRTADDAAAIEHTSSRAQAEVVVRLAGSGQLRTQFAEMFDRGELREQTGGVHTGALVIDGQVRTVRDDVSRHCLVDKLIGAGRHEGLRPQDCQMILTSRISGVIAAKLARAGIPVVATMSIPTTLAASIASRAGVTIIGRARSANPHVYRPGA